MRHRYVRCGACVWTYVGTRTHIRGHRSSINDESMTRAAGLGNKWGLVGSGSYLLTPRPGCP